MALLFVRAGVVRIGLAGVGGPVVLAPVVCTVRGRALPHPVVRQTDGVVDAFASASVSARSASLRAALAVAEGVFLAVVEGMFLGLLKACCRGECNYVFAFGSHTAPVLCFCAFH